MYPVITPLLKWAGGKRQLRNELLERLPGAWNTYYEPFIGGGAFLVALKNSNLLTRAVIGDLNPELINLYSVVKRSPKSLFAELEQEKFHNSEPAFRQLKDEFNALIGTKKRPVARAALFLYLNKHGYNGLWRVNRKGQYNVPFGRYAKLNLPSLQVLMRFSQMLGEVSLHHADFEEVVKRAKKGDFVYFDPPYHPCSKTAKFTDYTTEGFGFPDQERLARTFASLSDKGVFLMLSNSKMPEIEELYAGYTVKNVLAKRFINCDGMKRTGTAEIIVTNY